MKYQLLLCRAGLAGAVIAFALESRAQTGSVNFANDSSCRVTNGVTMVPATNGSAALYWAPTNSSSFVAIGAATALGNPVPGVFAGGTRFTPSAGGDPGQFQVRAWIGPFATYEQAAAAPGTLVGVSPIVTLITGNPAGDPPTPPASLVAAGLTGFGLLPSGGAPLSLSCASNKVVACGSAWSFDEPQTSGGCTNVEVTVTDTTTNGNCPQLITRTWQATDGCTTNSCSQTVMIVDTTPPVIVCGSNRIVECGVAWAFDWPVATDACGSNTVTILSTTTYAGCGNTFAATRTWLATDACGNTNTCSQTVTVVDTLPPQLFCASNLVVECGQSWGFTPPLAIDACGTNSLVVTSTITNPACGNTYSVAQIWLATDACGNSSVCTQMVNVVDTVPPSLTCASNKTVECGAAWEFDEPVVSDDCGTNALVVLGIITNALCGETFSATCTWVATDACGNSNTCSQTVTVVDTTPPTITCAANKISPCGSTWNFDEPIASDACSGTNVTLAIVSTLTNQPCPLVVTRTWAAVDSCGNSNTCSQTVTTTPGFDFTPPDPAPSLVYCTNEWGFPAYDNLVDGCGTNVPVEILGTVTNSLCPLSITRSWRLTHPCEPGDLEWSQTLVVICSDCPLLQLTKHCPAFPVPPAGTLVWTGTLTNASEVTVSNVVVVHDQPTPGTIVFGPATLGPGEGAALGGSYTVSACDGPHPSTLAATGEGPNALAVSNSITTSCAGTNHLTPGDMNGDGVVDQAELNAVLANYWPHTEWLYMTNAALLCDGRFQFELTNANAWNFTVLVSTNATDWTNLPLPAIPVYQFIDPAGTNAPQRLYRLQWP